MQLNSHFVAMYNDWYTTHQSTVHLLKELQTRTAPLCKRSPLRLIHRSGYTPDGLYTETDSCFDSFWALQLIHRAANMPKITVINKYLLLSEETLSPISQMRQILSNMQVFGCDFILNESCFCTVTLNSIQLDISQNQRRMTEDQLLFD